MTYGAGVVGAKGEGAAEIVRVLPALGYSKQQIGELEETIRRTECDVVVIGTPIDLRRVLALDKPAVRARYELLPAEDDVQLVHDLVQGVVAELIRLRDQ